MCDFPVNIANPHYGKPTAMGLPYKRITVPCGKCHSCHTRRTNEWFIRLRMEMKQAYNAEFVTLTYDDNSLTRTYNDLLTCVKKDVQDFFKRLRYHEHSNIIKYYLSSEYGEQFERPHYHAIIFNVMNERSYYKAWQDKGFIDVKPVTDARIKYITGYISKKIGIPKTDYDDRLPEFSLSSKNMGRYYDKYVKRFNVDNEVGYTIIDGVKYPLPRVYKQRIYYDSDSRKRLDYDLLMDISPEDYRIACGIISQNEKNLLNKISIKNYEYHIQTEDRAVKNSPSVYHWQANKFFLAQINNKKQQIAHIKNQSK